MLPLRTDTKYVTADGKLTQAGFEAFQGLLNAQAADLAAFETAANADIAALEAVAITATGAAPRYACRAWVNFNGTGTVAIRESGNVSSITDNGTGDYTINFTTAMPDAKYAVFVSSGDSATVPVAVPADNITARTASLVRIRTANSSFTLTDSSTVSVAVFR